jgi:zinc protease
VRAEDRYALDVLSSVLSGQGGRLFLELRDKRSLCYSVSSFSVEGIDPGYFGVYMGTSPDKVRGALTGIREQLDAAMQGPLPEAELERARRYLIGTHAIGLQKNAARAALIAYDEAYGVGADGYQRYAEHIGAVSAERVLEAARRTLAPERGALAILGSPAADVSLG